MPTADEGEKRGAEPAVWMPTLALVAPGPDVQLARELAAHLAYMGSTDFLPPGSRLADARRAIDQRTMT